jgi:transcriptional regulator with XRE-family HTH domain
MSQPMSDPANLPFYERIREERKRRGLSQQEVADMVGMKLRAYNAFENGKSEPQPANRRAIMRAFDPIAAESSDVGEETRSGWPRDIEVFLDMMGAYLNTLDEDARTDVIHAVTRRIFDRRL